MAKVYSLWFGLLMIGCAMIGRSYGQGCGKPTRLCCPGSNAKCYVTGQRISGSTLSRTCYCDSSCVGRGDCCADYESICACQCPQWHVYIEKHAIGGKPSRENTLEDCKSACISEPLCVAIDYENLSTPPCWIHNDIQNIKILYDRPNANHYQLFTGGGISSEHWQVYPGQAAINAKQRSYYTLEDCKSACVSQPLCVAIDYDILTIPPCWIHYEIEYFKDIYPAASANHYRLFGRDGVTSEQWQVYPGRNALKGIKSNYYTLEHCKYACVSQPLCVAIDYDNSTIPPCWIHNDIENFKYMIDAVNVNVNHYRFLSRSSLTTTKTTTRITAPTTTLVPVTYPPYQGSLRARLSIPLTFQGVNLVLDLRINPDIPEKMLFTDSRNTLTGVYNDNLNKASIVVKYITSNDGKILTANVEMGSIVKDSTFYTLFPNSSSDSDVTINGTLFKSTKENLQDLKQLCEITGSSTFANLFYPSRRKRQSGAYHKDYFIELLIIFDHSTYLKFNNWCSYSQASECNSKTQGYIQNYFFLIINLVSNQFFSIATDYFRIRLKPVKMLMYSKPLEYIENARVKEIYSQGHMFLLHIYLFKKVIKRAEFYET